MYSMNKIRCVGSLKCENDSCPYLLSEGVANMIDWPETFIVRNHTKPFVVRTNLRVADRLGTTEAFEKAFDIAVRMTNPLRNIPHSVHGDINTTTYKRKGHATSTIRPGDTHRHDRVAVTSQVTRRVKGRLEFDFTTTHTIPEDIPLLTQVSQITTISSSMDFSTELQEDDALHEIS
ncbi:hypothetical protein R1sor_023428 [Riccia sorocarpa]|uniref:Uncharacterized protein n=1 Tax=Riccia sorocarpa TaxID=122646 RepID=A0ABD3GPR1_9MARC